MEFDKLCPGCMRIVEEKQSIEICPHCGYDLKNTKIVPHQLKPFSILNGKYLTGKVIGEGGFGITYLGMDLTLEMAVAIKEFYPNGFVTRDAAVSPEVTIFAGQNMQDIERWRDNFIREARSLAKCNNLEGIVKVQEFFYENNTAYIVMEYVDGTTMKNYLKQNGGKLPADRVFHMIEPVIRSLQQVHETGLIHRDISPDNLMITKQGQVKLLDFGAARDVSGAAEKSLSVMLKRGYAPEEQYRSRGRQGAWSDVYALCATIYKCLTGVTPLESVERLRDDNLKMPGELGVILPAEQEEALQKGLAVCAEDRIQSMRELYQALYGGRRVQPQGWQNGEIVREQQPEVPVKSGRSSAKAKYILGAIAVAALCVTICGIYFLRKEAAAKPENKRVQDVSGAAEETQGEEEKTGVEPESGELLPESGSQDAENVQEPFEEPHEENTAASEEMQRELEELTDRAEEAEQQKDPLTMAEMLSEYCEFAQEYQNADVVRERVQTYYTHYGEYLLAQHDVFYGMDVSVPLYIQMSGDLDTAIGITDQLNAIGISVDGTLFAERRTALTENYRIRLAEAFDAQANEDIAKNGVISRTTLWKLMEGIPDTDLMDPENPEDPIMRRYAAALALHVDSELDSLDNTQAIIRIYDELENTDYNPLLVYYLAYRYSDVRAVEWMNYVDEEVIYGFSSLGAAEMKNLAVTLYTNTEYAYSRQLLRDYMDIHFSRP
ncbi:MAG: protein kinase [bacterium]|nr:protein kinase [bacterium]